MIKNDSSTGSGYKIQEWFDSYQSIKAEYGILDGDTYNIDENGYMIGIAGSSKVVFSKYQKQAGSREWASLIEAISTSSRRLPLFVILRAKYGKMTGISRTCNQEIGDY